ncbi:MAG: FAD:protein FMN transferase [Candidatus Enteromonas sp.]
MKKHAIFLFAPFLGLLTSCAQGTIYKGYATHTLFHSFFSWWFESTRGDYGSDIVDLATKINDLTDPYTEPKDGMTTLYTVNTSSDWVEVDPTLYEVLELAVELQEKTEGYFNPFIGELTMHWKETLFGLGEFDIKDPTYEEIEEAKEEVPAMLQRMNASSLEFNAERHAVKRNGEGALDLGGLVKGFAVNKTKELIKSRGGARYLINGGQSSLALGKPQSNENFTVSLLYTLVEKEMSYALKEVDCSTSAIYEQKVDVVAPDTAKRVTYSHILNPKTGMPETTYSMAFLVGDDSALLDAMSTSVMLADLETTRKWAQAYGFEYAVFRNTVYDKAKLVEQSQGLKDAQIPLES